jgi:hypothetical protein
MSMENVIERIGHFFGVFEWGLLDPLRGACWPRRHSANLLGHLRARNAAGAHIFLRPSVELEPNFLLVDDIDLAEVRARHLRPGRLVVQTSPGNFQAWVRSSRPLDLGEKREWLRRLGSDPGAAPKRRWGRAPGFRNRKPKHVLQDGTYPLARLVWVDPSPVPIPALAPLPPAAAPAAAPAPFPPPRGGRVPWAHVARSRFAGRGESEQDFAFALALLRRGAPLEEAAARIRAERSAWANHLGREDSYCLRTAAAALKLIQNQGQTGVR